MSKIEETVGFYSKMAELQEKLRKSEEERLKLEEKFTTMMRSCREEEEARLHAIKERYQKFLDEDKRRHDRNERILQALDRIESRATILSAKTERLRLLRKHYEAYLMRMYPLWKKTGSSVVQDKQYSNHTRFLQNPNTKVFKSDTNVHNNFQSSVPPVTSFHPANPIRHVDSKIPYTSVYDPYPVSPVSQHSSLHLDLGPLKTSSVIPDKEHQDVNSLQQNTSLRIPKFTFNVLDTEGIPENSTKVKDNYNIQRKDIFTEEDENIPILNGREPNKADSALTGYIERAAELLNVPLDKVNNICDDNKGDSRNNILDQNIGKIGNSLDIELEQNTSRDMLNISLSDDGILQEEVGKHFIDSFEHQADYQPNNTLLPELNEIAINNLLESKPGGSLAVMPVQQKKKQIERKSGLSSNIGESDIVDNSQEEFRKSILQKLNGSSHGDNDIPINYTQQTGQHMLENSEHNNAKANEDTKNKHLELTASEMQPIRKSEDSEVGSVEYLNKEGNDSIAKENEPYNDGNWKQDNEITFQTFNNLKIENESTVENNTGDDKEQNIENNQKVNDNWQHTEGEEENWHKDAAYEIPPEQNEYNVNWQQQQQEFGEIVQDEEGLYDANYKEHRVIQEEHLADKNEIAEVEQQEQGQEEYDGSWHQGQFQEQVNDTEQELYSTDVAPESQFDENWEQQAEDLGQENLYDAAIREPEYIENWQTGNNFQEQPFTAEEQQALYSASQNGEYIENWQQQNNTLEGYLPEENEIHENWRQEETLNYEEGSQNDHHERTDWQVQQQQQFPSALQQSEVDSNIQEQEYENLNQGGYGNWQQDEIDSNITPVEKDIDNWQQEENEIRMTDQLVDSADVQEEGAFKEQNAVLDTSPESKVDFHVQEASNVNASMQDSILEGDQLATDIETTNSEHRMVQDPNVFQESQNGKYTLEVEDSEESSTGFWNPQPSQEPVVTQELPLSGTLPEMSLGSSESKPMAEQNIQLENMALPEGSLQQYRNLLGVAAEPTSDTVGYSDVDEVEDQLAALMEQPHDSLPSAQPLVQHPELSHTSGNVLNVANRGQTNISAIETLHGNASSIEPGSGENQHLKDTTGSVSHTLAKEDKKLESNVDSKPGVSNNKPVVRSKKLPGLTKVLESDTESLHLDTTGTSNIDSDEFDFSSGQ